MAQGNLSLSPSTRQDGRHYPEKYRVRHSTKGQPEISTSLVCLGPEHLELDRKLATPIAQFGTDYLLERNERPLGCRHKLKIGWKLRMNLDFSASL